MPSLGGRLRDREVAYKSLLRPHFFLRNFGWFSLTFILNLRFRDLWNNTHTPVEISSGFIEKFTPHYNGHFTGLRKEAAGGGGRDEFCVVGFNIFICKKCFIVYHINALHCQNISIKLQKLNKQSQSTRGMDQVLWPSPNKKLVDVEMWPLAEVPPCTIPNFHRLIFSSLYSKEQQGG